MCMYVRGSPLAVRRANERGDGKSPCSARVNDRPSTEEGPYGTLQHAAVSVLTPCVAARVRPPVFLCLSGGGKAFPIYRTSRILCGLKKRSPRCRCQRTKRNNRYTAVSNATAEGKKKKRRRDVRYRIWRSDCKMGRNAAPR